MRHAALATLVLTAVPACEQPRTQMMIGIVTDIKAPNLVDAAELVVTRAKDGFIEQQVTWDISGVANQPFNLPGSYGVYSDGEELQLDLTLTGLKGGSRVVDRRAVLKLVEGKTLFFRMSLTAGCIAKEDCLATQSCVEGVCRDVNVDARQLPDFSEDIVSQLTCDSGVAYIDTGTGAPLPMAPDADQCPASLCLEGTCLKPPPEETGTRVVTGTQFTTFVQPSKVTNVPVDLSTLTPRALVPNPDGSFTTITGAGAADGTFVIPDVPKGTYYLNVGTAYHVTNASSFDLTSVLAQRPDSVAPAQTTTINFQNVTNLDPWGAEDELEAFAPDVDTWAFDMTSFIAPITAGATSLVNYAVTLQDIAMFFGGGNLIRNDPFFAMQLQARTTGDGSPYKAATKLYQAPPFTQTDGGTTNLTGAFTAIPQTNMTSATFPTTAWDAMLGYNGTNLTALHPQATEFPQIQFHTLVVHGQVGGPLYGQVGATADYLVAEIPHGADRALSDMTFGIPALPGTWATIMDIRTGGFLPVLLPGTTAASRLNVGGFQTTLFSAASSTFFAPQVGPVRAPRIDGQDLFGTPGPGISTTPTISWQAPAIGKPTLYSVFISRFTASGATTTLTFVGTLHTTETSVVVPPGLLQLRETYAVQIRATTTPNPDAPFRHRFPEAGMTIASSLFSPTVEGGSAGGGSGNDPVPPPDARAADAAGPP